MAAASSDGPFSFDGCLFKLFLLILFGLGWIESLQVKKSLAT